MQETAGTGQPPGKQFPAGFRFDPEDEEVVASYLYKRVNSKLKEKEKAMVPDYDLYGEEEPWERFGGDSLPESQDLFFFTDLKKKKHSYGKRINLCVGTSGGNWHGGPSGKPIKVSIKVEENQTKSIYGWKRRFGYKNLGSQQNGCWIMYEYTSTESEVTALCRLRKHNNKKRKKNNGENLVKRPAKNRRRDQEFKKKGSRETTGEAQHKNRKLNEREDLSANQQPVEDTQGNQQMGLAQISNEEEIVATTAMADGIYAVEGNGKGKIVAATVSSSTDDGDEDDDDDGFSWDGFSLNDLMGLNFSTEKLLGPMEDMAETASFRPTFSLEKTDLEMQLIDYNQTLPQLPSMESADKTDDDNNFGHINSDWKQSLTHLLQRGIAPNLIQDTDIEMIPNKFYTEDL